MIAARYGERYPAIVAAHETGAYSYWEIVDFFGLHLATVGRIVHAGIRMTKALIYGRVTMNSQTAQAVKLFNAKLSRHYAVSDVFLFGSRARGKFQPDSDADVAVLLHGTPGKFLPTKLEMADIAYDVLLETGIRIQPLPIWEEEWQHPENYSNPRLLENIAMEGVRL